MTERETSQSELVENTPDIPTYIPLFKYGQSALNQSRDFHQNLISLSKDTENNSLYWENKGQETAESINRMKDIQTQISEPINSLFSSIGVGMTYLKFLDDFNTLSANQIFDFFKTCLKINIIAYSPMGERTTSGAEAAFLRGISIDFIHKVTMPLFQRATKNKPIWFNGSDTEYRSLLHNYSNFALVLNPHLKSSTTQDSLKLLKGEIVATHKADYKEKYFGPAILDGIPDWLSDSDEVPDKRVVEQELGTDQKELELLQIERSRLMKQVDYLRITYQEKSARALERARHRWQEIKVEKPKFGDFVLYLHLLQKFLGTNAIQEFVDLPERISDAESISLWLEDNFQKTNAISRDGLLTDDDRQIFDLFLGAFGPYATEESKRQFRLVRDTNKKGYNALKFNLGPIINILSEEEMTLAREFLTESETGSEGGPFISFLADIIVSELKRLPAEKIEEAPLARSMAEYRNFLKKFLIQNRQWLYNQYYKTLFPSQQQSEIIAVKTSAETEKSIHDPGDLSDELDDLILESKKGNLAKWQIFYSEDQTTRDGSLVEIVGQTLEEKSHFLNQLLVEEQVPFSIKPGSIISAIDWKTGVPQEVERLIPHITVKGQSWKKMKRQKVRIIYQMSPQKREFIFFVYQKQAWSYDLPAA